MANKTNTNSLDSSIRLTEDQATFLALLLRAGRATAYTIAQVYEESPVSSFGTSKGKIYPLVKRLHELGFLSKTRMKSDFRGTELLECSEKGRDAVHRWVREIKPVHVLLDDPLRTKVQSFDLLSRDQRLQWIVEAKIALQEKLRELDHYAQNVAVPFSELVHDNAVSAVRCRMDWLDRLLAAVVKD